jgi:hypothetical protein
MEVNPAINLWLLAIGSIDFKENPLKIWLCIIDFLA